MLTSFVQHSWTNACVYSFQFVPEIYTSPCVSTCFIEPKPGDGPAGDVAKTNWFLQTNWFLISGLWGRCRWQSIINDFTSIVASPRILQCNHSAQNECTLLCSTKCVNTKSDMYYDCPRSTAMKNICQVLGSLQFARYTMRKRNVYSAQPEIHGACHVVIKHASLSSRSKVHAMCTMHNLHYVAMKCMRWASVSLLDRQTARYFKSTVQL